MKFPKCTKKLWLAPMAGITDCAFRSLCSLNGAGATVTELVSSHGIVQNQEKSLFLTRRGEEEEFFGIQLFGDNPKIMALAAHKVEKNCDFIDINMGCPAPKVVKTGAGSQLLTRPNHIRVLLRTIQKQISVPLTAKIRIGPSAKTINAITTARICEEEGVSLITVHGRTSDQGYQGLADWSVIREVKEHCSIPIVGNGDITSPLIAKARLQESHVDYLSIGRAASGNPFLFKEINMFLESEQQITKTKTVQLELFQEYLSLAKKYDIPFSHQQVQAQHFTKGIEGAPRIRAHIVKTKTPTELFLYLHQLCS